MNASSTRLPPALAEVLAKARARWAQFAPRERLLLTSVALLIAFALVWVLLVQPAWRTLRDVPAQIDAVELQLQQMQRLAAESRELRTLPAVQPAQAEAALRGATERLGSGARLSLQGDRATLTFTGVSGEALVAWLGEVRSAARARPDEAKLTRDSAGYSGSVVLGLARPN